MLLNQASRFVTRQAVRCYSSTSVVEDRIVVAVGGNALQRRGERLTIENMLKAAAEMAPTIADLASKHELVLTHGKSRWTNLASDRRPSKNQDAPRRQELCCSFHPCQYSYLASLI